MELEWVTIDGFPNYLINNLGDIVSKSTGRRISQSRTWQGAVKVGLVREARQHTRSVKVLVADTFVPGRDDIFDTPIHMDGNQENNRADNLAWRPRWFAHAYHKQVQLDSPNDQIGPLLDETTGTRYVNVREAGLINGLLFRDIRKSIATGESVFPTFQCFRII